MLPPSPLPSDPLPVIDRDRCSGCGRCVEVCPTGALVRVRGKAVLAHPTRCTYCRLCDDVCPEAAIALPFTVVIGRRADARGWRADPLTDPPCTYPGGERP